MNKYGYTVMKNTDPICPILVTRLTLFLHVFMSDVGSSDDGFNEGCHGHNVF